MSHTLEVKDFLHLFARKAELELFLSILNRKKMEPVGEGCPFGTGIYNDKLLAMFYLIVCFSVENITSILSENGVLITGFIEILYSKIRENKAFYSITYKL